MNLGAEAAKCLQNKQLSFAPQQSAETLLFGEGVTFQPVIQLSNGQHAHNKGIKHSPRGESALQCRLKVNTLPERHLSGDETGCGSYCFFISLSLLFFFISSSEHPLTYLLVLIADRSWSMCCGCIRVSEGLSLVSSNDGNGLLEGMEGETLEKKGSGSICFPLGQAGGCLTEAHLAAPLTCGSTHGSF